MKQQCPDAWLVNFTNPAGMVTEAAIKHGGWERTLGLCNVPIGHTKVEQLLLICLKKIYSSTMQELILPLA